MRMSAAKILPCIQPRRNCHKATNRNSAPAVKARFSLAEVQRFFLAADSAANFLCEHRRNGGSRC